MVLISLEEKLRAINCNNPQLKILEPDQNLYSMMLYQHKGNLEANPYFIGNQRIVSNKPNFDLVNKFNVAFQLAKEKNVDCFATPEYSCPWESISFVLDNKIYPEEGKLWIIGCESITPNDLIDFVIKYPIDWIYEDQLLKNENVQHFFDPVCYIFQTRDNDNQIKLVITIQFKTHFMSVHSEYKERDYLIRGETIYILKKNNVSIRLITLICSDGLDFNTRQQNDELSELLDKGLIIHLQMNPDPRHHDISKYRKDIYSLSTSERVEVICLNWAKGSSIMGKFTIPFPCTAYYIKSTGLDNDDNSLEENHKAGLYYTYNSSRKLNAYYFHPDEYIHFIITTKVLQRGLAVQSKRTGPRLQKQYRWNNNEWRLEDTSMHDGFSIFCQTSEIIFSPNENDCIKQLNKERLLMLSCGRVKKNNWHEVNELDSLRINENEVIYRMTFTYDPHEEAEQFRAKIISHYKTLQHIVNKQQNEFPISVRYLKNNAKIHFDLNKPCFNVYAAINGDGGEPVTMCFIGSATSHSVQKTYEMIKKIYHKLGNVQSDFTKLVIWYNDTGLIKSHTEQINNINSDPKRSGISIDKE